MAEDKMVNVVFKELFCIALVVTFRQYFIIILRIYKLLMPLIHEKK